MGITRTLWFLAGSDGYVEVDDVNGQAAADAIRLVRVP